MRRLICNICKNVISESKFDGRGGYEQKATTGARRYSLVIELFAYGTMTFDLCETCARRLVSGLERGVLEPDDLPELPEEENHG